MTDTNTNNASVIARGRSLGSGVIVDADGYIITNAHVVKGAQRVRVLLTAAPTGSQVGASLGLADRLPPMDATIVGALNPTIDLALLKIEAKGLPALSFADYSSLKKGQVVLAFGNPEGFENSVTMGVVSAVARQVLPAFHRSISKPMRRSIPGTVAGRWSIQMVRWWGLIHSSSAYPGVARGLRLRDPF